jgi:hypothetical protein
MNARPETHRGPERDGEASVVETPRKRSRLHRVGAAVLALGLVAAACGDSAADTTAETPAPAATDALSALEAGTVVIADPGATTEVTDDVAVYDAEIAIGDGAAGLVVFRDDTILRVAADGTETTILDAASLTPEYGPVTLRLEDVTTINGAVTKAVVVARYGQEYPDVFEEIWLLDLDSGATESIYQLVAVESTITRVSAAAGTVIASISFEGGTYFEYLTIAGQPISLPGPYADTPIGAPEFPELITQAVLSLGGRDFAYIEVPDIQTYDDGFLAVNLVVWDLETGTEVRRIEIELTDGAWPGRLDYNGTSMVLGRRNLNTDSVLTPLRIASLDTGTLTDLDTAGTPSLVR